MSMEKIEFHQTIPTGERGSAYRESESAFEEGATAYAAEKLTQLLDMPSETFSAVHTYDQEERTERLSPELDKIVAEMFSNQRYIVEKINEINGYLTTKDPREKYEKTKDNIDQVNAQLKQDWQKYQDTVSAELIHLQEKREAGKISEDNYEYAQALLEANLNIYEILTQELELAKRGLDWLGDLEIRGESEWIEDLRKSYYVLIGPGNSYKANSLLEIKHLLGGHPVIIRGYIHDTLWQENFGGNNRQNFGLAQIYAEAKYVAIEGYPSSPYGDSLKNDHWDIINGYTNKNYAYLMEKLVKEGFNGCFLELDGRFRGANSEKTFDVDKVSDEEFQELFAFIQKQSPTKALRIGSWDKFKELFLLQRTGDLGLREFTEELRLVKDGTFYHSRASVDDQLNTSATPTGLEFSQLAFSDALSVVKMFVINRLILAGKLEPGLLVDFQGAAHLHYKSYFLDHPQEALEVVLDNVWEILASHPEVRNRGDILEKLENMDEETWQFVFEFIFSVDSFHQVAPPTSEQNSVEIGENQRPLEKVSTPNIEETFSDREEAAFREVATAMAERSFQGTSA